MPIYEYLCEDCGRKSGFLVMNVQGAFAEKFTEGSSKRLGSMMSCFGKEGQ